MQLLTKLVKQRKESLDIYTAQNRADLAADEAAEIAVIERYLPAQMSEDELKQHWKDHRRNRRIRSRRSG